MTTPRDDTRDHAGDHAGDDARPLGSDVSEPADDDAMAGPVYPPEETEPDAHRH